ncbi:SulP family inorganic anion transporter [Bacillus alkalicellulosilyticus]|uniref:SulP family inorganic anion transporter n=1 Tax=Alkalihalobacterium alkalicellulosilyticum TaxID=1912214 RepID=UPI0009987CB5|nr:solute carrier family 26 protein [Bacillus alkalicellulosilyticus]
MKLNWIPAFDWISTYSRDDLRGDMSAGLIVAIMLIPQGMAYAMLAGLPPVVGLYASTIPLLIYALFGTSRHLAVGPVAMVSLLVFSGVSAIAEPGSSEYISLVLLLMMLIGLIQFLMGVLRLGFLVTFLSHAVISGFTSAAAIIIGVSQLKHVIGLKLEAEKDVFLIVIEVLQRVSEINPIALILGFATIGVLVGVKKVAPKLPGPLVVVVLSIFTVYILQLQTFGVKIVGDVPSGLPSLSVPAFSMDAILTLLPIAITISLIGFMESIAMAKAIAAKEKYKVNANKELVGLGLANVGGSFFSGYPVTGGFSRSAVNHQAGAKTPFATMITAILVLLTLVFFTDGFYFLPNAVLGAIIIVAVFSLIDVREVKYLFKVKKIDGWTCIITFVSTLLIGIEQGIFIGVVFSLLVFIWRSAYPHVAVLGFVKEEQVFRNIKRYPEATVDPQVLIFRVDASLYFANMTFLENQLRELLSEKPDTKSVIFDFSGVNSIDAVAIHTLEELIEQYQSAGITIVLASVKGPVMDLFKKVQWDVKYGKQINYLSIQHAITDIK